MKKIVFQLDDEQIEAIEGIKKSDYYNKSYSTLYRDLINAGLSVVEGRNV